MTIETILAELAARHGNDWPRYALTELAFLAIQLTTSRESQPAAMKARFELINAWILETLYAGIAFRQTAALEH